MTRARIGLALGPLLFAACCLLPEGAWGLGAAQAKMLGVLALMVAWWVSEAAPLAATAMLPLALYPLLGILPARDAAAPYANPVLFLFVGGFLIALAIQKWSLHERMAALVIMRFGTHPRRVLLGMILTTIFISMWVSNTATTLMMLPVAMSVLTVFRGETRGFAAALVLSVAYASSIGGMMTPIGTAPNALLLGTLAELYPGAPRISFVQWMLAALPVGLLLAFGMWGWFALRIKKSLPAIAAPEPEELAGQFSARGPMSSGGRRVAWLAAATAFLWIFRADIHVSDGFSMRGWGSLLPWPGFLDDGTVAMAAALLLFALPAGGGKGRLLDWEWAAKLPWDVVLLLGGGFALAGGFKATGLDSWLGGRIEPLGALPPALFLALMCLAFIFISEVTSNTAQAGAALPVLASMAAALSLHPPAIMFPAALACSCGFMLPTSTPPNAIVFASGHVTMPEMARAGFVMNLWAAAVLTLSSLLWIYPLWGVSLRAAP